MRLIGDFLLICFFIEAAHCSRSSWNYPKPAADSNRRVMPIQEDRQKRLTFSTTYTHQLYGGSGSGSAVSPVDPGSGVDPVDPEPPVIFPFKKCVPYYIANRTDGAALPIQCPPLPTPSSHCDCPPPDDVKTADDDVILDELNIEAQIHSQYVKVSVDAVVFNPHDGVQLADFNLRLPDQAFISYFHINVNDEVLVANIDEKEKAKKKFNESVRRGQTAATVEARGKNEFKTNVAVSKHCRIRLLLQYEYIVAMTAGQFSIPIHVTPSIPALTRRLKIRIHDHKPLSCIKPEKGSGYDDLTFNILNENEAELLTELSPDQIRDFVLTYKVKVDNKVPGTTLVDENGYVLISYTLLTSECRAFAGDDVTCPIQAVSKTSTDVSPRKPFKLCLLFIVDVSGSMYGEKITQAKKSLLHIIDKLSDDDCIGIILFSGTVARKTASLIKVGPNRKELNRIISKISARGSTNFDGALTDGVAMMNDFVSNNDTDCVHLIVSLTDGYPTAGVTDSSDITNRFKRNVAEFTRTTGETIYPYFLGFGTNYDLNFDLLEKLAADNAGFARRIYRGSDVEHQLVEFFKEIACPILCSTQLKFQEPGLVANITNTDFDGCFFDGSQFLAAAHITDTNKLTQGSQVTLEGSSSAGQEVLNTTQFLIRKGSNTTSIIERAWAYLQITRLLEQVKKLSGEDKTNLENEILLLSLHYKFVTRLTSLVVVKPCENRTLGSLESVDDQGHTTSTSTTTSAPVVPQSRLFLVPAQPTTSRPSTTPRYIPLSLSNLVRIPGPRPAGVTSDPHFLVETLSGDWLCYTLKGIEGEVYNLVSDVEYSINGLLIGTVFKGSEQTYFGSITITHQSCETGAITKFLITADNGLGVIGEGSLSWEDVGSFATRDQKFTITMNQTLAQITSNEGDTVQFALLRSKLNCTKYSVCPRKHYLGFYVPDTTGLSSKTHGMIGQFLKQPSLVDGAQMKIGGKMLTVKPFERLNGLEGHYQKCWSTDDYGMKFLDGTADEYLVKDLFDSNFIYSQFYCTL